MVSCVKEKCIYQWKTLPNSLSYVRLREHTMYTKRYIIDLKIRPYFEKKILSEITVADVRAWQNELLSYNWKSFICWKKKPKNRMPEK